MDTNKMLFTIGQFAKLHNINKRTLHYYDDIGLFSPSYKGDNGYRYYTYTQSLTLEMLLTLRELNMSIEEITNYMNNRSILAFRSIIHTKTSEISETIKRLKGIQQLLSEKETALSLCEKTDLNAISIIECPQEYLLLSHPIMGTTDDDYLGTLMEHMQALGEHRQFNKSYGSMMEVENILKGDFKKDAYFFTRVKYAKYDSDLFIKQKGKYIRAFAQGSWDKIPDTYQRIIAFAKKNNLYLKGYSFEVGINEIAISRMDEYITQITILCE